MTMIPNACHHRPLQLRANPDGKQITTYADLRKQVSDALRNQHPEWIDKNGESPLCELYDARFAKVLSILQR